MRRTIRRIALGLCLALVSCAQSLASLESQVRSLYESGHWADAARLAASEDGHSPDLDLYHALSLAKLGNLDLAKQELEDGRRRYPTDARFDLELAGAAYREHDAGAAKKWGLRALSLDPTNEYGNDFLGSLFLIDRNLPAALKYWNRIGKPVVQDLRFDPAPPLDPLLRERIFAVSGGQVLTLDRLRSTEANLSRLDLLDGYRLDLSPREEERFDLDVRSFDGEQPLGGVWGKILPLVQDLPYQTIRADFSNLTGKAIELHLLGRWDPDKRRIAVDLSGPVRMNPRLKYRLAVDARDEDWDLRSTYFGEPGGLDGLVLHKVEGGGDLEYGLTNKLEWTSGLWLARRDFRNGDSNPVFADSWSLELRNELSYRLWDVPEHRFHANALGKARTARLLGGPASRFAVVEGRLDAVWLPQAKGDDRVVQARISVGKTFGALPFDDYFMLGMERDNDLWFRGNLGAQDGRKGTAPLGTQYSLFQISLDQTVFRFPFGRVQLGPFFDSGRIGDPSGDFGSSGWMLDTGVEAKVQLFGRLSWVLVYGRNLRGGSGAFYTAGRGTCRAAGLCF